jgi:hypothetical protein
MQLPSDSFSRVPSGALAGGAVALSSFVWLVWQVWGIEIMRTPWEDDILYVLPAVNWVKHGSFAIPQLGSFSGADISWGWHVPGFSLGMAAWLLVFPVELWSIRLFTLLPAAGVNALLLYMAFKVGALRHTMALLAWLCIIYFDKSIVSQSVTGRMEFHALVLLVSSLYILLFVSPSASRTRLSIYIFLAGLLFGLSAVFHPITLYFGPALAVAALLSPHIRKHGVLNNALIGIAGSMIPVATVFAWFHFAGPAAQQQFLLSVFGSSAEDTRGSLGVIVDTITFVYRFQPAMALALVLVLVTVFIEAKEYTCNSYHTLDVGQRCLAASFTALVCFVVAMLRGSTQHGNYYTILTVFFILALIAAYVLSQESVAPSFRIFGVTVLWMLALNNIAFAAFKTYIVGKNLGDWSNADLEAFLEPLTQDPGHLYVLSPKLWLWAESRNLNWRVSYLTVVGQPQAVYDSYHAGNLRWNPDVVILDSSDWRERQITPCTLDIAGFQHVKSYSHVFAHRAKYAASWDLQVYRGAQ